MNPRQVLATFDAQLRRHPELGGSEWQVERDDRVVRRIGDAWTGVAWCDLDEASADAVIAAQDARFAELSRPWEWPNAWHSPVSTASPRPPRPDPQARSRGGRA
jgi:hypothetical protein